MRGGGCTSTTAHATGSRNELKNRNHCTIAKCIQGTTINCAHEGLLARCLGSSSMVNLATQASPGLLYIHSLSDPCARGSPKQGMPLHQHGPLHSLQLPPPPERVGMTSTLTLIARQLCSPAAAGCSYASAVLRIPCSAQRAHSSRQAPHSYPCAITRTHTAFTSSSTRTLHPAHYLVP